MKAVECDRCGNFDNEYNVLRIHDYLNLHKDDDGQLVGELHIDLCPACSKELLQWLKD